MASSSLPLSPVSLWKAGDAEKADVKSCGLTSVERYLKAQREPSDHVCGCSQAGEPGCSLGGFSFACLKLCLWR